MPRHFLPIELDSSWLLVDATLVREVLGTEAFLPIPRARPELPGVVAWRGRAVPLVNLGRVLGLAQQGRAETRARTLIVNHERGVAAIPVDSAREVRSVPEAELRQAHTTSHPYASTELDDGERLLAVIDLYTLLGDLDRAARQDHE